MWPFPCLVFPCGRQIPSFNAAAFFGRTRALADPRETCIMDPLAPSGEFPALLDPLATREKLKPLPLSVRDLSGRGKPAECSEAD